MLAKDDARKYKKPSVRKVAVLISEGQGLSLVYSTHDNSYVVGIDSSCETIAQSGQPVFPFVFVVNRCERF